MSKNSIQAVAFTIRPESMLRNLSLKQLSFPGEWLEPLNGLQAERSERTDKPNTLPVRSLNNAISMFVPYLLTVPHAVRRNSDVLNEADLERNQRVRPPWLLAREEIPIEQLWFIIKAWFIATYGECESFATVDHLLHKEDLQWISVTLSLLENTCENGTADIPSLAYKAIPAFIADMLVTQKVSLLVGAEKRALVRVPIDEGAELMTWPPVYALGKDKKKYGYSYTVKITLQTIVGLAQPRIHFHYGVRRWYSDNCFDGSKLYLKRRTSVYLRPTKARYEMLQGKTFTVATIEAVKVGDEGLRIPLWMNLLPEIAKRLHVSIPDAELLVRKPLDWLEECDGVEAGIVYANTRNLAIGAGMGPDVCEAITEQLVGALSNDLSLCPPHKPYPIPRKVEVHPLMKDIREMPSDDRLIALKQSVGSHVTIEVYWQTEAIRDMLVNRIVALLIGPRPELIDPQAVELPVEESGNILEDDDIRNEEPDDEDEVAISLAMGEITLENPVRRIPKKRAPEAPPEPAPECQVIPFPDGGQLTIVTIPLGAFGSPLPIPDSQKKQTMHTHTNERASKIRQEVLPALTPTLSLIELPNYREKKLRKLFGRRDPKHAIRLGMASVGRVTQFITNDNEGLKERSEAAVRDGLRQLGYLPYPIGFSMPRLALPESMLVMGIWFVRITNRRAAVGVHLPVIVMLHTQKHQVFAWLPHDGRIRPYYQALLDITQLDPEQVKRCKRQDALRQVQQFLLGDATRQGENDIAIFASAQNARSTWHGLYNTEALFDALRFERGERPLSTKMLPVRFRLIRLRTSLREETPEWYVPGSTPSKTAQGLWTEQDADEKTTRLFYSIAAKPHTAPKKYVGKQLKPRENYRISSIVETMPLILHEDDDPAMWAIAVDQWRKMGFLTSDMTLFPLPLELAQKMDEYAEVIGPWVFPEEWSDDAEEDEVEDM